MVFSRYRKVTDGPSLNLLHIIIGMIPAGVLGVLFHSAIKEVLFGPGPVVISLVAGGILMIVAEVFKTKYSKNIR